MDQPMVWEKFYVHLSGRTNDAHQTFVRELEVLGQIQVFSPDQSDYLLVFCPIASRVGTDINEALDRIPDGKPAILVVMHHTFNPDHVVAPSRRQVENRSVVLTVDVLFYEDKLLNCNRNDIARHEVQRFLGVYREVRAWTDNVCGMLKKYWPGIVAGCAVAIVLGIGIGLYFELMQK